MGHLNVRRAAMNKFTTLGKWPLRQCLPVKLLFVKSRLFATVMVNALTNRTQNLLFMVNTLMSVNSCI